jgi:segregation and condensation protein B
MKYLGILEGLLFVSGDEGLSLDSICKIMDISETEAKDLLKKLKERYEGDEYGIKISYLGDAFKFTTKPEHKEFYQKLASDNQTSTLSVSSLETLAIIAYKGPITRVEIDELRGVSSSYTLRKLLAQDLIKVCGKSELPGKPNLYETTKYFLDYFGLATLNDLPKIEVEEHIESDDLYNTIFKEN